MENNVISFPLFATPELKTLNIYLFKVNNMNTGKSKTGKIINFEHTLRLFVVFL